MKLRGAYEAITRLEGYKDKNYQEYNVETKLVFPRFLAPFLSHSFKKHNNALSELSVRSIFKIVLNSIDECSLQHGDIDGVNLSIIWHIDLIYLMSTMFICLGFQRLSSEII